MKNPKCRKASVEVRKLIFVYSHNSHRVWEWSIAYSLFILSSKRSIFNGTERESNPESFETSRLNSTRTFERSETAHVVLRKHGCAVQKDFYYGSY